MINLKHFYSATAHCFLLLHTYDVQLSQKYRQDNFGRNDFSKGGFKDMPLELKFSIPAILNLKS